MRYGHGRRAGALAALTTMLAFLVPISLPATATAQTDAVVEWNEHAVNALVVTGLQSPGVAGLHLAMVHGAVYDAVNAIDGGYEKYLVRPRARRSYSKDAAAAQAAHDVLVHLLPDQKAALDGLLVDTLADILDGAAQNGGVAVGKAAAKAMIRARTGDGRFGVAGFPVGSEPGEWRPTLPLFANDPAGWLRNVDPFLIRRASQFRTAGPNELTSTEYAADFNEVKDVGALNGSTRSADQTDIAKFWADNGAAMWSRILRQLSDTQDLTIVENARLYAMAFLTGADAIIGCWYDKADWNFWRPITAIREADTDRNPATDKVANWEPLIATPPFPEHPSGHGCFSGSVVRTLQEFFDTNRMAFSTNSAISGTTRKFTRFTQARDEVIDARVYSGIHFRTADEQGAILGRRTTNYVQNHFFEADN